MSSLKRFLNRYGFYLFLTAAVLSLGALAYSVRSGLLTIRPAQEKSLSAMADADTQPALLHPLDPPTPFAQPEAQPLVWLAHLGLWSGHEGWDIPCATGSPVYAMHDGEITAMYRDHALGNVLVLRGTQYETLYAGLREDTPRRPGDSIRAGELLGYAGESGRQEPQQAHLHLQLTCLP